MTDENPLRGDPPPLPKGVSLRLYSMEYCPFAERVRIALNLKGIQYDVVNCHLYKKPKFLLEANPVAAAVPVLLHENLTIYESLICIDYIDAAFPDGKKLFPSNPGEKAKAQLLVANFSNQVIPLYYKDLFQRTKELRTKLLDSVHVHVESELKKLDTPYFGGSECNGVDANIFPWLERLYDYAQKGMMEFSSDRFPLAYAYVERMSRVPGVKEVINSIDNMVKFYETYREDKSKTPWNVDSKDPLYIGE